MVLILTQTLPSIIITKHQQFRVIHANGIFGSLGADEGRISFYTDIIEPRIKTGGKFGDVETDKVNRDSGGYPNDNYGVYIGCQLDE